MTFLVALIAVPGIGALTVLVLRACGLPGRRAAVAGFAAAGVAAVALAALFVAAFGACLSENDPGPLSWPWSPRREFCSDPQSPAALGAIAIVVVPALLAGVGNWLRWKGRARAGLALYLTLLVTPALPSLYVASLPVYRLDSYPVLHQPLLRPGTAADGPRACYVYGIAYGPRAVRVLPDTPRICVEFARTPEALSLTTEYDEGRTGYDLDLAGKNLSRRGLPVVSGATGVKGLVVERVYGLRDSEARLGAKGIS
jgi:hypothetical protein